MNYFKNLSLKEIVELLKTGEYSLSEVTRKHKDSLSSIIKEFHNQGYLEIKPGCQVKAVVNITNAMWEYAELGGFPTVTVKDIANKYKVSAIKLSQLIQKYYPDVRISGKPDFNEKIFDSIDNEEKAYWLGFIWADGCISSSPLREDAKTQFQFELSLASKDVKHLEKFAKFISYKKSIFCDDVRCRISLYSKHLWNVLNSNGCTPQKSLTLCFPKIELFKYSELVRHFIRGYWDGDGCISYKDKEHSYMYGSVLGTDDMLNHIAMYLHLDNPHIYILHPDKQSITKYLNLSRKESYRCLKTLYNNSTIYLQRKYNRFLELCRLFEKSSRLLETNIGEGCDANPEITKESKESLAS